jgi:hypothetical protein
MNRQATSSRDPLGPQCSSRNRFYIKSVCVEKQTERRPTHAARRVASDFGIRCRRHALRWRLHALRSSALRGPRSADTASHRSPGTAGRAHGNRFAAAATAVVVDT